MKRAILITIVVLTAFASAAHDFYFGFAEMEYNTITQKIEMTLTVTTHDFERSMEAKGKKIDNIASIQDNEVNWVTDYINEHLQIKSGDARSTFHYVGHEVTLEGTTYFYFESDIIALAKEMDVTFDVLMETYTQQQNKLTFYYEDRTLTAAFTRMNQTQTIYFEKNEQ